MRPNTFDYIVVGAGSSGCVVARRLGEQPDLKVLLLEAGPGDNVLPVQMPAGISIPALKTRYDWGYLSEPEAELHGRRISALRGRVLGGSSSVNGMIYLRGHARDYDRWVSEGADGWSYAEVLPYFKRMESFAPGADNYRGGQGPIQVSRPEPGALGPLHQAFLKAGAQSGYPRTADVNGHQREGFSIYDANIKGGRRCSAARGYLHGRDGQRHPNVETGVTVIGLIVEKGTIRGVKYLKNGVVFEAMAEREVVLSAGAYNTPQLLMLSGIGPADHLRTIGVDVTCDLPGVGENLQDHLETHLQYRCTKPIALHSATLPWNKLWIGLRWLVAKSGPGATNHYHTGAFIRSRAGVEYTDIQYHFIPYCYSDPVRRTSEEHGFRVHVGPLRQKSRGTVRLKSADPTAPPAIHYNYLSNGADLDDMRRALELAIEIIEQTSFDPYRGRRLTPLPAAASAVELDAFIRESADTAYHPVGTCRMGTDRLAVTDPIGKVHGLSGLRIADASLMPSIVSANPNATCIMMGEKIADHILGRQAEPAVSAQTWAHPAWRDQQR